MAPQNPGKEGWQRWTQPVNPSGLVMARLQSSACPGISLHSEEKKDI